MSQYATKAADMVQRTIVCGLLSCFGYYAYQIYYQTKMGVVQSPYLESTYFKDVENKVKEELQKQDTIDNLQLRDMYPANDDDDTNTANQYLKDQVRPNFLRPEFKKEFLEKQQQQQQRK